MNRRLWPWRAKPKTVLPAFRPLACNLETHNETRGWRVSRPAEIIPKDDEGISTELTASGPAVVLPQRRLLLGCRLSYLPLQPNASRPLPILGQELDSARFQCSPERSRSWTREL